MKVTLIMPAYNVGPVVAGVIARIPAGSVDEIIAVDDGSRDDTPSVLSAVPGLILVRHNENHGYGGAQVTLLEAALDQQADVMLLMHADGGHFPEEIPHMLAPIRAGRADVVVGARTTGILQQAARLAGSRFLGALFRGPMPPLRLLGHIVLAAIQNAVLGTHYQAWHSGFRSMTREAVSRVPFHTFSRGYLFDAQFLLAAHRAGLRIEEIPVSSCYASHPGSSVKPFAYGLEVLGFIIGQCVNPLGFRAMRKAHAAKRDVESHRD